MNANNTVALRLALEGAEASAAGIDKVKNSMASMAASFTVGNLASRALETGMAKVGLAIDYVMESAKMAARFETLGVVMQTVGRNAGYTGQQMMDAAKGVQALGITMLEARESVTKMASAHIDLANAQGLARVAQDAAVIGGINSSEAFKAMIYGIQSGQTEVLRTIGINVSFEASYRTLAKQLGTTAEALTEAEKTTARTNVVMAAGRDIAGAYEDAMGTAGKQMTSLARYSEDAKVKLGAVFNDALLMAVGAYTDHLKDSNGELDKMAANKDIEAWANDLANGVAFVADSVKYSFATIATAADTAWTALTGDSEAGGWEKRMAERWDPSKTAQGFLAQLQAKRELDSRSMNNAAYSGANNPSAQGPATIVFDTPEQKAQYKDRIAALDKSNRDAKSRLEEFQTATEAIMHKGLTTQQKIDAERRQYLAKLPAGVSVDSEEVKQALRQIEINARKGKATGDAAKQDVYAAEAARLYSSTMDGLAKAQESASAKADGLSKAQEALRVVQSSPHWEQYNRQMREQIIYAASLTQAEEDREAAKKLLLKAQADQNAADQKAADALHTEITGLRDGNAALELHNQEIGLTTEALNALTLKRIDDQIAVQAGIVLDGERMVADGYVIDSLQEQINKLDELKKKRGLLATGQTATLAADESKKVQEEWKKGWEETDRIAREAFTGWAENGVSMAETIGKSLKKAMLSAIYEATIKPISFSIYSSVTGGAGGAGALSQAGSAAGIYNAGSSLGFIGAGTSAFGYGASLQAAGMGTEAFSAGMTMMTEATGASSFMAGAGQALGAIGPVGWAALAAIAVLSLQDHGTPTQNTGNASASFDAAGNRTAYQTYFGGSSANTDAMIGNMQLAYLAGAKSLGINAAATNFSYGSNTGKDSQNPMFALSGGSGASSYSLGETAYSDAAVSLAASRAVFAALQGSDLPQYLAKAFNGAVADTMTQDQITNTLNFASSLKEVRSALLETREPLQILKDNVATGFATLATNANTFKTDFVAAIDAGVSPATLGAWQALANTMDQLTAATEAANTALATSKSAVLGASEKVSSVLRSIGNDVKSFADAASTAHDNLVGARLNISEALWSAQDRVIELQRQAADGLRTFAASIDDFLNTINPATSSSASLTMLKAQLSTTAVLAAGGDTGAQGQLISQAQAVLKAAEASSTDRVQYARSEAFVRSTLATVKKAVDPAPIVDAVAVAIVDPMAVAKAELKAAQDAVVAYSLLAQATDAITDRSTRLVAGSVAELANAYGTALVANTTAQANYAEALRVTAGLQLTMSGSFD
ncbi:MAG: hypothetical protein D4R79_13680, partial [Comamonadaceae bacterium]